MKRVNLARGISAKPSAYRVSASFLLALRTAGFLLLTATLAQAEPKTVKLLAIGNSFSANALRYFNQLVEASGNQAIIGHAYIGGCSLARHMSHVDAHEKNPADPAGRPYGNKQSLKDLLTREPWEVVTIQQLSHHATRLETFVPHGDRLIAYIRQHAPQAEIVVHQTWAYRDDHPTGGAKQFLSTDDMYRKLRHAYDTFTTERGLRQIPSGDAFEAARRDPDWGTYTPDPAFDPKTAVYPALPKNERRSLHGSFSWRKDKKTGKHVLGADRFHANRTGEYLLGCVWFEFFFQQSVIGNPFIPPQVTNADAAILQRIAHRVVTEKKRPERLP